MPQPMNEGASYDTRKARSLAKAVAYLLRNNVGVLDVPGCGGLGRMSSHQRSLCFFLGVGGGHIVDDQIAYLVDALSGVTTTGPLSAQVEQNPMVNWDVVSRDWQSFTRGVRQVR